MITEQTKSYSKKQIYKTLHPWVRQWFDETFEDFTPAQKKSIVDIHKGNNILVSSPTGSGKTLTAFLSILSELTTLSQKGELEDKVYCIYISPLKALDNDIEKNLIFVTTCLNFDRTLYSMIDILYLRSNYCNSCFSHLLSLY